MGMKGRLRTVEWRTMTARRVPNAGRFGLIFIIPIAFVLAFGSVQAVAQTKGSCDQYRPSCSGGNGDNGQQNGGNNGAGTENAGGQGGSQATDLYPAVNPSTGGGSGDASGGNLPFTGYPLTGLVGIMLLLLGAGIAARGVIEV